MIPIGDSIPIRRTPVVTRLLVAANVAVFVYEIVLGRRLDLFVERWGVIPVLVSRALAGGQAAAPEVLVTLVTSQFIHAGLLHIGGNMLFLWIFGDNVEDRLGRPLFLFFYLVCGIVAALTQVWFDPVSRTPLIGASGAIAGVLGAYLLMYPTALVVVLVPLVFFLFPLPIPAILAIGLWFAAQVLNGVAALTTTSHATSGIAFWAHVGGFAAGLALALVLPRSSPPVGRPAPRPASAGPWQPVPVQVSRRPLPARLISLVADVVSLALGIRLLAVMLDLRGPGPFAAAARFVEYWTAPLVAPFAEVLPTIVIFGLRVELATLAAIVVVQLLLSLLASILPGAPAVRPRRST